MSGVVNELLWVAVKRTFTVPGPWPLSLHSLAFLTCLYRSLKAIGTRVAQKKFLRGALVLGYSLLTFSLLLTPYSCLLPAPRQPPRGAFRALRHAAPVGVGTAGSRVCGWRTPPRVQRQRVDRGVGVRAVAAGLGHSLAATSDGRVFGWGVVEDETLGLGLTADQQVPTEYSRFKVRALCHS